MPQTEALSQEITALRSRLGGELVYLNPNKSLPVVPRFLFGFHKLKELRTRESELDLHHLYNPDPFPFPVLRRLRRPVIYTITSGVGNYRPNVRFLNSMAAVAVADERTLNRLKDWGVDNCKLVRPGIDTTRFSHTSLSLQSEIRILVGSAPWTKPQFRTKGVEALLEAARQDDRLHLVFLWRGVLTEEMERRVSRLGLEKQVTVFKQLVDVNRVLATVHASITLATGSGIVKSYPHSLLESLAAGKPVLVSRAIPMADYVAETNCGLVIEAVTPEAILTAVEALESKYQTLQKSAQIAGHRDFSQQAMIASYQGVYTDILKNGAATRL
jgi:glycosyltransferase involved in cell wall biosynthesis